MEQNMEQNFDEKEVMMEICKKLSDGQKSDHRVQELMFAWQKNQAVEMERMNNEIEETKADVCSVKSQTEENTKELRKTNVLASPTWKKQRVALTNVCKARVHKILGESSGCTYATFQSFFFKIIYKDMENALKLASWDGMSMKDYGEPNSLYDQAWDYARGWKPSKSYTESCLRDLIERRDNGFLPQNRCRALTDFLSATDNGKNLPWE